MMVVHEAGRTPEEIKSGLDNCTRLGGCVSCPYFVNHTMAQCTPVMAADALAYIHQLELKLAKLEKRCEAEQLNASVAIRELEETKLQCLEQIKAYADKLAEYKKPLVPMTLEEVVEKSKNIYDNVVWLEYPDEYADNGIECVPAIVSNISRIFALGIQHVRFLMWPKSEFVFSVAEETEYGSQWRCWPRKPTEEERKVAKWDK